MTNDAPAVFPLGTNLVTWTAVDTSGNIATCQQTVTVRWLSLVLGAPEWLPDSGVRLTLLGNATGSVTIQWSGEAVSALSNWPTLIWFSNFLGATQYIDSDATNFGQRYYRAVAP